MTPTDLRQAADRVGGVRSLAILLHVGKDWLYRRISGETPISERDLLLLRGLGDLMEEMEQSRKGGGGGKRRRVE